MTAVKDFPAVLKNYLPRIILAGLAPFLLASVPGFGFNNYTYSLLNLALIYSLVALGLNLLTGYAGLISLGHSGLLAVGAYTTAALTSLLLLPFWVSLAIGALLTGLLGGLLAIPALRLSGPYLALVTLGFTVAVPQVLTVLNFRSDGLEGLKISQPSLPGFGSGDDLARYYLFMPLVFLLYVLTQNLTSSKIGRAWLALRESEVAAQSSGISLAHYKILAFALSAVFTGIAGGLYAGQVGRISVTEFNLLQSVLFLVILVVGGMGKLAGSIAGALLLTVLPELVNRLNALAQEALHNLGLNQQLKNPQYVLYGLLILVCVLFMPEGLVGLWQRLLSLFRPKSANTTSLPAFPANKESRLEFINIASQGSLDLRALSVHFGGLTALSQVSLEVKPGEIVGLIGPNGAGKTTVFNCLSRFYKPAAGELFWREQNLTQFPPHRIIELGIARTFQNLELFKNLSVLDNLLIGQYSRLKQSFWQTLFHLPKLRQEEITARQQALEILGFLKIENLAQQAVRTLSYGQQKLVELGRALVARPQLLLLDEPAAGLNQAETAAFAVLLRQIQIATGLTILLVEHDMDLVMGLCDRIYVLDFGKLIASGTPAEIRQNPAVIEAYLGLEVS